MDNLIAFLEAKCLEPKLYWRVKSLALEAGEDPAMYELEWHRDRKAKWHLRRLPPSPLVEPNLEVTDATHPWQVIPSDEIQERLESLGLDTTDVWRQVESTALQQVVFAKLMVDDALEVFGADKIEQAIKETDDFLHQLGTVVSDLMGSKAGAKAAPTKGKPRPPACNIRLVKD